MVSIFDKMYSNRFNEETRAGRRRLWKALVEGFFQQFISAGDTVADVGAGFCEFLSAVKASRKIAVEKLETSIEADSGIEAMPNTSGIRDGSVDVVFMSNVLEHLKDKDEVIKVLSDSRRILKPGGRIIILQPNIRYLYREYWDFFDHYVPLSDKSLREILMAVDFKIERVIPRFLPYTTKSSIPKNTLLVKLYLRSPMIWRFMGRQMLILARKGA